jgi:hypothetical protein
MNPRTTAETAAAAREIVVSMVRAQIDVSVFVDRTLVNDHRSVSPSRAVRPTAAVISVEMIGPDDRHDDGGRMLLVVGEAHAWCNDEIMSAARRAAERIIRKHPTWRRQSH